jgi:ubiquitin-protein ligase
VKTLIERFSSHELRPTHLSTLYSSTIVMSIKRLMTELDEVAKDPPAGCSAGPVNEDITHWVGMITGPEDSAYQGQSHCVAVQSSTC